jgi:hypothetical protein
MKRYLINFLLPEIQDERIEDVEQRSDSESVADEEEEGPDRALLNLIISHFQLAEFEII